MQAQTDILGPWISWALIAALSFFMVAGLVFWYAYNGFLMLAWAIGMILYALRIMVRRR